MPNPFRENPFREKKLVFDFGTSLGATRYEQWSSHVGEWQHDGKTAVDFIYPDEDDQKLFFTEIKDYIVVSKKGRAGGGKYSLNLAHMVAQKVKDSIEGFELASQSDDSDERSFYVSFRNFSYRVVFHWEFKRSVKQPYRKMYIRQMKNKLKELLHGVCTHIAVENIGDYPSSYWTVRRLGRNES